MKRDNYEDIIHLPYCKSEKHKSMPLRDRAAQFTPFAALTGYEAAVEEASRFTEEKAELSEDRLEYINERLNILDDNIASRPKIKIIYYKSGDGGEGYQTCMVTIKKLDKYREIIITEDGEEISFGDIKEIEGEIFDRL